MSETYKSSGVDIKEADRLISQIKPLAKKTQRVGSISQLGGFGALFHMGQLKYKDPVLVSSTDGVGTKLKLAFMANQHKTIGIDLVAMCVNDVLAMGAEPLFFLDYFSTSKLKIAIARDVIEGISKGCIQAGCALSGGETAEMPSLYQNNEYDLAGFSVGVVEKDKIIDGSNIKLGHKIIGLASSGFHSNGYSLIRKIFFEKLKLKPSDKVKELGQTVAEVLLKPTTIYVKTILPLLKSFSIDGMAHITGGGFTENIPRILPKRCAAFIDKQSWAFPKEFIFLQNKGSIATAEMFKTFNMGIGFILIVPHDQASDLVQTLKNKKQTAYVIGEVVKKETESVIFGTLPSSQNKSKQRNHGKSK